MSRHYSIPESYRSAYTLPDIEVFQLTATEAAAQMEIAGGWFWWTCLPGCLPDSCAFGPFKTHAEALADAMDNCEQPDDCEAGNIADDDDTRSLGDENEHANHS